MPTQATNMDPDGRLASPSETAAAINAGIAMAAPFPVTDETTKALVYVDISGQTHVVDLVEALAPHQDGPARKKGSFKVHDGESFVEYMGKHALSNAEVWADSQGQRVVGVINAHEQDAGDAGWGDHRVVYDVAFTEAWKAWAALDGKLGDQASFAELIEDRLVDIHDPEAADLLEIVQSFEASIGVRFESSKLLSTGERIFTYKENIEASAGRAGQLAIPKEFTLALQPFEGADTFPVIARLRYRITDGQLRIGFKLVRPEDVLREAFESVVATIRDGVECPVYKGVSG